MTTTLHNKINKFDDTLQNHMVSTPQHKVQLTLTTLHSALDKLSSQLNA